MQVSHLDAAHSPSDLSLHQIFDSMDRSSNPMCIYRVNSKEQVGCFPASPHSYLKPCSIHAKIYSIHAHLNRKCKKTFEKSPDLMCPSDLVHPRLYTGVLVGASGIFILGDGLVVGSRL